ncbi:MAG: SLC26A/SulP transporter family protein [Alphaproteobacteria bacterium]|nr:SLC26A/SulP transporter family protein [Alphaproteobacteria bacterium]
MTAVALPKPRSLLGDLWGGSAAMLVALPSAIAFGVTIFSAVDVHQAGFGALAGIVGATAIGLVASVLGGTRRLISAPCAPAAAVLSALALELVGQGTGVATALLLLAAVGLLAGVLQVAMGVIRLGTLIRFVPYPVVSGYLSGVGLVIITSQLPRFLGVPKDMPFWTGLVSAAAWRWQGIVVGAVTVLAMVLAPKVTRAVPAPILALAAGVLGYFGLGLIDPMLLILDGNRFVVGVLGGGDGLIDALVRRWSALSALDRAQIEALVTPALTLAVLLSIDTLKTCVVLDALTRSRHNSNRELIGQGVANVVSAAVGGIPGSGTMGATLVNLSSGGDTRFSGVAEGVFSLIAFLVLAPVIAWVPVAALSGILIVVGYRMIDWHTLHFLKARDTVLDFVVIATVVAVALSVSLIAASGAGVALAVLLFLREQVGGQVVRRKAYGNEISSNRIRLRAERELLARLGDQAVVLELQGSLFFGTAYQLSLALEPELKTRKYIVLDMRRVTTVDATAGHVLDQVKDMLAERGGVLILSSVPRHLPTGRDVQRYFDELGLVRAGSPVKLFEDLDEAIEWVEDRVIEAAGLVQDEETPLDLHEIELFRGRKEETFEALEQCMDKRSFRAGEPIFTAGETGDELFLIRQGLVQIVLPIAADKTLHLGTFGRGAFFGEMAFLTGEKRSADAVAFTDGSLFVLSRQRFDGLADHHKRVALNLMEGLASMLAGRLRHTSAELRVLEE